MTIRNPISIFPGESTQLVFLGGLPGSGKTTYGNSLEEKGWIFYDDFQARAVEDSPQFRASRYYAELVSQLRAGRRCVVSDIRVIHEEYRRDAAAALRQDVGEVLTELHLFENSPEQCADNVRKAKGGRRMEPRLQAIAFWSEYYSAPSHAILHRVWRSANVPDLLEP